MAIPVYVFDIDGTLADCTHRLHYIVREPGDTRPKDWDAFFAGCVKDEPIEHLLGVALTLFHGAKKIAFVTGRPNSCRQKTESWLGYHFMTTERLPLYMRTDGDRRDDSIVKSELMDRLIADGYTPIMVFEDRKRVVDMWRARGIPCAQVAEGEF